MPYQSLRLEHWSWLVAWKGCHQSELATVMPNSRFLLDAFRSPLRATHRAAKPER
jgi:hypothetical protein